MSSLLTSLADSGDHLDARRRAALDAALRDGLPGPRSERWKYTSLRALERRTFANAVAAALPDASVLAQIPAPRLVFANGLHHAALSDVSNLPNGVTLRPRSSLDAACQSLASDGDAAADHVFAQLNIALAQDGAWLDAAAGTVCDSPLHLVFVGVAATSDQAWHLHHRITVEDAATLTIVEHHLGLGAHQHLANHALEIRLSANAVLHHARVQHEADGATLIQRSDVVLAQHAHYRRVDLELGAALSRHELTVSLAGEHAAMHSGGVMLANGRRHLDTRLDIRHIARDTVCDLRWRGLAADRGRAVFHGGIVIEAGADGSDARLSNKNLLLSPNAEIDAQPVLEIYADEVKAAHGATVGRLDEAALFYLRSRGLPLADAQRLLTAAFCREPLGMIGDSATIESLTSAIDDRLAQLVGKE
jgi:Fe-S cluster assembly protein SufD